jgi:hypothetical protein
MSWSRRILTAGFTAGLCLLLAGCPYGDSNPPTDVVTGVGRASDGTPLVVFAACSGYVDSVNLATIDTDSQAAVPHFWTSGMEITGVTALPLVDVTGWTSDTPYPGLKPRVQYVLQARGSSHPDDYHAGTRVQFTVEELTRLTPGQVRFEPLSEDGPLTTTMAVFRAHACKR